MTALVPILIDEDIPSSANGLWITEMVFCPNRIRISTFFSIYSSISLYLVTTVISVISGQDRAFSRAYEKSGRPFRRERSLFAPNLLLLPAASIIACMT